MSEFLAAVTNLIEKVHSAPLRGMHETSAKLQAATMQAAIERDREMREFLMAMQRENRAAIKEVAMMCLRASGQLTIRPEDFMPPKVEDDNGRLVEEFASTPMDVLDG